MARRTWTALEERDLRMWRSRGVKVALIALRTGRSESSVRDRLRHLGIVVRTECVPRRKRGQLTSRVKRLLGLGLSVVEVATALDVSHSAVSRIRKRLGVTPSTRTERAELAWKFRRLRGDRAYTKTH